jgi:uncharacterized protein YbjT (DUF2867 family)
MLPRGGVVVTVLVVGGNGQLGAACCEELIGRKVPVRASVRAPARGRDLGARGAEIVTLDLTGGRSAMRAAVTGAQGMVLSANAVTPRAGDRPDAVDEGISVLVEEAVAGGVRRIVLPSVPVTALDDAVPFVASRRRLESQVVTAAIESRILRLPPFMECWLALVGSSLPLRGEPYATIGRPSPFLNRFRGLTGSVVEDHGLMLVPGSPQARQAFVSVRDAARMCVEAACRPGSGSETIEAAGPEVLSWRQVADTFERVLGRRVRILSTPATVYAVMSRALGVVSDVPARTMALNRYLAAAETAWSSAGGGLVDPGSMITVEAFLRDKASLPSELPSVA